MNNSLIEQFNNNKQKYESLKYKCKSLITDLLNKNEIKFHKIESRVKDKESFVKKINSESKRDKYHTLDDVTDVLGIRIITYLEEDVDKIAELLNEEFKLDLINSVDKRWGSNPDVFGYASLHQVLSVSDSRINLPEYEHLKDLKFEVQIRSILQHAWAEIEHDLGYKSKLEIPEEIRRDFSRIAGLLELADREFIRIKAFLNDYSIEMESKIRKNDLEIPIDKITLTEYLVSSKTADEIMSRIFTENNFDIMRRDNDIKHLDFLIECLAKYNVTTIAKLAGLLNDNKDSIPKFFKDYNITLKNSTSMIGNEILIIYLCYVIIYRDYSSEKLLEFLNVFGFVEKDTEGIVSRFNLLKDEKYEI